jgi:hypothetical protein
MAFYVVDEIADLNDRLVGLQQSKDQDRDLFEQQLQQLRTEYRETKDQLTSENMMLSNDMLFMFFCLLLDNRVLLTKLGQHAEDAEDFYTDFHRSLLIA